MATVMPWLPEKQAGFLLAALLAEDRALDVGAGGLTPPVAATMRAALETADLTSTEAKARTIARWLRMLRPELTSATLTLPPRLRALLSRAARPPLRAQLNAASLPIRPDFSLDERLMSVLLRIARHAGRTAAPAPERERGR